MKVKKNYQTKIGLSYAAQSFLFGEEPFEMTFTYVVDSSDDKRILLQLPRNIKGKPLITHPYKNKPF